MIFVVTAYLAHYHSLSLSKLIPKSYIINTGLVYTKLDA